MLFMVIFILSVRIGWINVYVIIPESPLSAVGCNSGLCHRILLFMRDENVMKNMACIRQIIRYAQTLNLCCEPSICIK